MNALLRVVRRSKPYTKLEATMKSSEPNSAFDAER
jgi:hypothetical protein